MSDNKMPMNRSIIWILVATLLVSGSGLMGWLYYLHAREQRLQDDQYNIVALIQSTPDADKLKTTYLAEWLGLSMDRPMNLYKFNTSQAIVKLMSHSLIKEGIIQKIPPGTLYVHYQMRSPIAFVGDFSNTVMDEEGYLFPFRPFFTSKRIPTLYLGINSEDCQWGTCLKKDPSVELAFDLLCLWNDFQMDAFQLKAIDVSDAYADSYGKRQIVLTLEGQKPIYIRLSSDRIKQNLVNFRSLHCLLNDKVKASSEGTMKPFSVEEGALVIDLRIPRLGYIQKVRAK